MRDIASKLLVTMGISVGLMQLASAADLPRRAPAPLSPPPVVYNWTGCYVGGNIGAAWGNVEASNVNTGATVSPNSSGFAGGGQIGCDYQAGQWVVGFRDLIDGTSMSKSAAFSNPGFGGNGTANSNVNWYDTLTVRGGYLVQPNVLLYAQGGAAWSQWNVNFLNAAGTQIGQVSGNSQTGWTVGGGIEWMFMPHWSTFIEYDFMGFGTRSATFTACAAACVNTSAKADIQNVLVGVNYKF